MINKKLPNPPFFSDEQMSDDDWNYYFECRKKYDNPISWEENSKLSNTYAKMRANGKSDEECIKFLTDHNYALMPNAALAAKHVNGFKSIAECNLFFAKKEFPDEF